jgi:uncharacterized membrane protein YhhN
MLNAGIIVAGAGLLAGLLIAEKKGSLKGKLVTKPLASLGFIMLALVQPHPVPTYYYWILAGLIFCLGGDVFLALPQKSMFRVGLISFLMGHVFYVFGFLSLVSISAWIQVGTLVIVCISTVVFIRLKPHLGSMLGPVMVYVTVISLMLIGALAVFNSNTLARGGRNLVMVGAVLFYLSDLFVARNRFVKKEYVNRLVGLPLYYTGQYLLALSVNLG